MSSNKKSSKKQQRQPKPEYEKDEEYYDKVIPKRLELFESIKAEQNHKRLSATDDEVIKICLYDGRVEEGIKWKTCPLDFAKEILERESSKALVAKVDDVLWDLNRPFEADCNKLEIFTFDSDEGRKSFWHSSAHILGQCLEKEYGCRLCIGPCTIKDEGFYYDAYYGDLGLSEHHFKHIEAEFRKAVESEQTFERLEVSREQAFDMFSDNKFKVELIEGIPEAEPITVYRCGKLVDLCRGPHIPNTSFVKAFSCLKASAAYWLGNKDRESLQRVYGISYPDDESLKEYKDKQEEARKYDHREIGKQQRLFYFDESSPGIPNYEHHGYKIKLKLKKFLQDEYEKRGYKEVQTADMCKMELWETSGHAANYKKNMFSLKVDDQEYALKPMNCPCHCKMFAGYPRSCRDLPICYAEFGGLHRNEASGALSGLIRVRGFEQDDAHIFCMKSQVKEVAKAVLEFVEYVYKILGFTYNVKLSTRPEEFIGEEEVWNGAEAALAQVLDEFFGLGAWELNEGDGAFYGPKIDITISDAMGRKHQCATLQLDFQLPVKFDLSYSTENPDKVDRPVIIHRAILGSFERMIAILTEHYKGKWPLWLSPYQVLICPVADRFLPYAEQIRGRIHDAGFSVDVDKNHKTIMKKIRDAQPFQYNYILVVGNKEAATGQVSVRQRKEYNDNNQSKDDKSNICVINVDDFLDHLREETATFSHRPISRRSQLWPRLKSILKFLLLVLVVIIVLLPYLVLLNFKH